MKKTFRVLFLLILATAAGYAVHLYRNNESASRPLLLYGNVDVRTVSCSLRVPGRLSELLVDEGDRVVSGQLLGNIDPAPYRNAVREAEAGAAIQKAQLALLEAGYRAEEIAQVRQEVNEKSIALEYARSLFERQAALLPSRAVSANDVDNARTARDQAESALQAARDKLLLYESGSRAQELEAAGARLLQAEAVLAQARLQLEDTRLLSPAEGVVLTRAAEPGTMLAAGATVLTLSLDNPVRVRAYVDGANLARAVPGSGVSLHIDGRDEAYSGKIGFVSPSAEFTPKSVQTPELRTDLVYRLRIIVEDPDEALRQGMPVTISFPEEQNDPGN